MKIYSVYTMSIALAVTSIGTLFGFVEHSEQEKNIPSLVAHYALVDLGETDIDPVHLSRVSKKLTLGARINNEGVVIGNTSRGGFVTLPHQWKFGPEYEGLLINFHEINNNSDLLVALVRSQDSVEWMRWPMFQGEYKTSREPIKTIDPFVDKFTVAGFNDDDTVIAYGPASECGDGKVVPLTWDPCCGLTRLGEQKSLCLEGTARGLNNEGVIVGVSDRLSDQIPFVWSPCCGLLLMNNYRPYFDPTGWVEFADLLITGDCTVYGTYRVKHLAETHVVRGHFYEARQTNGSYYLYNAFVWNPKKAEVRMLDLHGMRLTAVNKEHIIVGSLLGEATICMPGKAPAALDSLMEPEEVKEWQLLEVTDINDQGQVVGYGWYKEKIHFFLANPLK